jgi:rhamnopyranosyl-N-acetylglucosaminyl-diphospho-decaprenol beta-1,3/1,4-galactofuranosyltransferase
LTLISLYSSELGEGLEPTVSVVLPTYERADLVGRAVRSVLTQTFANFELVVVDDASTDDTEACIRTFSDVRIRYIKRETNGGVAAAQNSGLSAARGAFITFLHSDDEYRPEKLEAQLGLLLDADADVGVVECATIVSNGSSAHPTPPRLQGIGYEDLLAFRVGVHISAFMFKRECLDSGRFDETLRCWEDWDLLVRLVRRTQFAFVDAPLVVLHQHQGPRLSDPHVALESLVTLANKYRPELKIRPKVRALWHFKVARFYLERHDQVTARQQLLKSARAWPWNVKRWYLMLSTFLGSESFSKSYTTYKALSGAKRSLRQPEGRMARPSRAPGEMKEIGGSVAAVIVTYNRRDLLRQALTALRSQTRRVDQVFVVDNASSDGTIEMLRSEFGDVTHIRNEENVGPAGGFAQGMQFAAEGGHDWLWLFNDDDEPLPRALESLLIAMREIPSANVGVLGCWVLSADNEVIEAGNLWHNRPRPVKFPVTDRPYRVDLLNFNGTLVSSELIRTVGVPQERLFMMFEESEFCLRTGAAGEAIFVTPQPLVICRTAGSRHNSPPWRGYYQTRNQLALALERRSVAEVFWWFIRQVKFIIGMRSSDRKFERVRLRALGARHAVQGKLGKVIDPEETIPASARLRSAEPAPPAK